MELYSIDSTRITEINDGKGLSFSSSPSIEKRDRSYVRKTLIAVADVYSEKTIRLKSTAFEKYGYFLARKFVQSLFSWLNSSKSDYPIIKQDILHSQSYIIGSCCIVNEKLWRTLTTLFGGGPEYKFLYIGPNTKLKIKHLKVMITGNKSVYKTFIFDADTMLKDAKKEICSYFQVSFKDCRLHNFRRNRYFTSFEKFQVYTTLDNVQVFKNNIVFLEHRKDEEDFKMPVKVDFDKRLVLNHLFALGAMTHLNIITEKVETIKKGSRFLRRAMTFYDTSLLSIKISCYKLKYVIKLVSNRHKFSNIDLNLVSYKEHHGKLVVALIKQLACEDDSREIVDFYVRTSRHYRYTIQELTQIKWILGLLLAMKTKSRHLSMPESDSKVFFESLSVYGYKRSFTSLKKTVIWISN